MQQADFEAKLTKALGSGLMPGERKLICATSNAAADGVQCDLGGAVPGGRSAALCGSRTIRTEVLYACIFELFPKNPAHNRLFRLVGAQVAGSLPFLADSTVEASLLFEHCVFQADVEASRLEVRGDLVFENCCIQYLSLSGSRIGGDLCLDGLVSRGRYDRSRRSVCLQNCHVSGSLMLRTTNPEGSNGPESTIKGIVDLTSAAAGTYIDDVSLSTDCHGLILHGFRFKVLHGATDARTRLQWLAKGDTWQGQFLPQPYKQLAKVLHEMGHEADAREILFVLSCKLGEQRRKELRKEIAEPRQSAPGIGLAVAKRLLLAGEHVAGALLRFVVGYGYKPFRSLAVLVGLIIAFWIMTIGTWYAGDFAPNSAVMLQHVDWNTLPLEGNAAEVWAARTPTGRDWESFHSLAYAADVVIPIIEFGQTGAWAPSPERGWWGKHLWWLRWVFTTLGWIVTALGAAALTGIIRRD